MCKETNTYTAPLGQVTARVVKLFQSRLRDLWGHTVRLTGGGAGEGAT
jgi:hypothetical protein